MAPEPSGVGAAGCTPAACAYAAVLLLLGVVLHPELKAFYHRGGGGMKNTASCLDVLAAALALGLAGGLARRRGGGEDDAERGAWRPKLRAIFAPAVAVFLVIVLSTLANYLSFQVWVVLGPVDLVFTAPLARWLQGVRASGLELAAVALGAVGALAFAWEKVRDAKAAAAADVSLAVAVTLLCRAVQALHTVILRNACRHLSAGSGRGRALLGEQAVEQPAALRSSVLQVAALKMGVVAALILPYALLTEGLAPWRELATAAFWADGRRAALLLASAGITAGFQLANVGFAAEAGSLTVALVGTTLSPLAGLAVVVLLASTGAAGRDLAELLGLRSDEQSLSPLAWLGVALFAAAVALHAWGQFRRRRRGEAAAAAGCPEPPAAQQEMEGGRRLR